MTTVVYANPGLNPSNDSYVATEWTATIGGTAATILHWERTTEFAVTDMWAPGDILDVNWLKFATDVSVQVILTLTSGAIVDANDVHFYPPHAFALNTGSIVFSMTQDDKFLIIVGDEGDGGTLKPIAIQALAPLTAPTGTVVIYDGSQTVARGGQTLHFTGPAVYEIGQRFPMEATGKIRIDGDVILIGSLDGNGVAGWRVSGHGALSGEFSTPEAVRLLATFDDKFPFVMVNAAAEAPIYTIPNDTECTGITIFNAPFFNITSVSVVQGVMILSPWWGNCDGTHPSGGPSGDSSLTDNCLFWTADDCIYIGEDLGSHVVTSNLLATSAGATIHLGYWPASEWDTDMSLVVDNDVAAFQSYYDAGSGVEGGHIVVGWSDGERGEETHVISNYAFDELRVWALPSNVIRAKVIELSSHLFPWGTAADQIGNILDITFSNVTIETTPINLSRIYGKDDLNTPHDISFTNVVIEGVTLYNSNSEAYIEVNEFPYNINYDQQGIIEDESTILFNTEEMYSVNTTVVLDIDLTPTIQLDSYQISTVLGTGITPAISGSTSVSVLNSLLDQVVTTNNPIVSEIPSVVQITPSYDIGVSVYTFVREAGFQEPDTTLLPVIFELGTKSNDIADATAYSVRVWSDTVLNQLSAPNFKSLVSIYNSNYADTRSTVSNRKKLEKIRGEK